VSRGADIFYHLTSNLLSSTTINTDFAETEVDTRQVNLTRFPLFFPEKRAFFLEEAGVFQFGLPAAGNTLLPFFSRRIGLVGGETVPILFGEKLTGKAGRLELGLLDVMTRDSDAAPGGNFVVGRAKFGLGRQSYVGGIFTHGEPAGRTDNSLGGVDIVLATSNFMGRRKNCDVAAFGLKTSTPGIRINTLNARFGPRPKGNRHIRQVTFEVDFSDYHSTVHHSVESRRYEFSPRGTLLLRAPRTLLYAGASDELTAALSWRKSARLTTGVEIRQYWVRLAQGRFETSLVLLRFNYFFSPRLALTNFVQYDTDSRNIGLQSRLRWILRPGQEVYLVLNHEWQEDPLDRFEARRTDVRAKLNYTFRF
jgi:hypothetical protein